MTELEKMERAKMYIDKLANGINPIDDRVIPDGDAVNNVRLSRCFFYVSDVLRQVIENGGVISGKKEKKTKKVPFNISFEEIQKYPFSDELIPLSTIAENINGLKKSENMKKLSYKNISDWLVEIGMLYIVTKEDGKTKKKPTESGVDIGITSEWRNGIYGEYEVVLYNRIAQQFIVDNIDALINSISKRKSKKSSKLTEEDKRILEKLGKQLRGA